MSAHSDANTPRLIPIFGWNGWTGAAGLSVCSDPFPPLSSGKSLQILGNFLRKNKSSYTNQQHFLFWQECHVVIFISGKCINSCYITFNLTEPQNSLGLETVKELLS